MDRLTNKILVIIFMATVSMGSPPAFAALLPSTPKPVSGRPVTMEGITPADVLARVELLRHEVEGIRFEMGKPKDIRPVGKGKNAAPHETYFQAMTLFLKANRLALELTGSTGIQPQMVSPLDVKPFHVWEMVNAAFARIVAIRQELGITSPAVEQAQNPAATTTEVGYAILHANRQINLMLERRFTPSDTYQQITVAMGYAKLLLGQFPGAKPMAAPPSFIRGKEPAEVFFRLMECHKTLGILAHHSQLEMLHIDRTVAQRSDILPSDVYDIATLLVSDLAYIHAHLKDVEPPGMVPYPGRKFPSHAYQQAAHLHALLITLTKQAEAQPNWLSR